MTAPLWMLRVTAISAAALVAVAQQIPDPFFRYEIQDPAYASGEGPLVAIDSAHHNFHTIEGGFAPFSKLLAADGFQVRGFDRRFTRASLDAVDVLVAANALAKQVEKELGAHSESAFKAKEVGAVDRWLRKGGRLLLMVDHMPFPDAAGLLAEALGLRFENGFSADGPDHSTHVVFSREGGTLTDDPITGDVKRVVTFGGSAFMSAGATDLRPLLRLSREAIVVFPSRPSALAPGVPHKTAPGALMGAALAHGKGRVAVFAEAAMFTAQLAGPDRTPMGMNAPEAAENAAFVLNLLRWLAE